MSVVQITMQRVSAVATLPAVALRIMRIAEDPTATAEAFHAVLSTDPALTARVLKVVNSAFYGRSSAVSSTRAAIQLLGVNAVRNIAIAASLTKMFRGGRAVAGFDPSALWVHSIAVGAAAQRLATMSGRVPPEEALLAGLLHDIGILVAMQAWLPEFTAVICAVTESSAVSFTTAESEIVGATHEAFGEALCAEWRFPPVFAQVCAHHHDPLSVPLADRLLPALVHVADVLAARAEAGFCRTVSTRELDPEILVVIGVTEEQVAAVEVALQDDLAQAIALFNG